MGLLITISASFLLSTSSLLQHLRYPKVLISLTSSPKAELLTLDPTSIMSRRIQDPKAFYGSKYLPDPQTLTTHTAPAYPPSYASSTANSDGWREQRPLPQYFDSLTLPPIQGSPQPTTALGYRDTGRSVQNTHPFNRPEERASERHAPTAYGFRETKRSEERASERHAPTAYGFRETKRSEERAPERHAPTAYGFREIRSSEGRGSGKSGGGDRSLARNKDFGDLFADSSLHKGIPRTDAFHTSTSDKIEQPPPKYHGYHGYSEQEQNKMIECIKARMTWRQISKELGRSLGSVKTHWYKFLVKDPRAKGVKYALKYDL